MDNLTKIVATFYRNARNFCDGFHFFHTADADFWNPQSARNVGPLLTTPGALHRATLIWTKNTVGSLAQRACSAQPGSVRYRRYTVTSLMHAYIAKVAENHLISLFGIGLQNTHEKYRKICNARTSRKQRNNISKPILPICKHRK